MSGNNMASVWRFCLSTGALWVPCGVWVFLRAMSSGLGKSAVPACTAWSVMMALLATLYSILSGNGIWYAMNLLSASFFPGAGAKTAAQIGVFKLHDFLVAVPIHLTISLLVGLLYGAMLPMFPRRPILLG